MHLCGKSCNSKHCSSALERKWRAEGMKANTTVQENCHGEQETNQLQRPAIACSKDMNLKPMVWQVMCTCDNMVCQICCSIIEINQRNAKNATRREGHVFYQWASVAIFMSETNSSMPKIAKVQIEASGAAKKKTPQSITIQNPETQCLPPCGSPNAAILHWPSSPEPKPKQPASEEQNKNDHHKIKLAKEKNTLLGFSSWQVNVPLTEHVLWSLEKFKTHADPKTNY